MREHPPGTARAGVVAGLDQLAVDVDAVGVGPADQPAVGARDVGDHPRRRGLAVGAGDRDDRDLRGDRCAGPSPGSDAATRSAAALDRRRRRRRRAGRPAPRATARPIAWARSRCRHGKATTSWCGSLVGRTRTASRAVPASAAIARTSRATARIANRCRNPESGAPGRASAQPDPAGEPGRRLRPTPTPAALMSSVSLIGGAREVEVRALQDPELDEGRSRRATLPTVDGAQAPIAWKPPSTCTISPVVAGKKSREQRARRPRPVGSWSDSSQPERGAVLPHRLEVLEARDRLGGQRLQRAGRDQVARGCPAGPRSRAR